MTFTEMHTSPTSSALDATPHYDVVCIGFGAAQLATAIANRESKKSSSILFLERKSTFSWGSGSHMSRTRMESPFMYDLATLRNPRTSFSYVNYLHARKRLIEFANSDRLNPLREEFEDYMKWCAEQFNEHVRYSSEVVGVAPEVKAGTVQGWRVTVKDNSGKLYTVQAASVVAPSPTRATGPAAPPLPTVDFLAGQRIMSMDEYQSRRNELRGAHQPPLNVSVVGSGDRTIEILDDLLSCPRLGNITVVTEDASLLPLTILDEAKPPQPQLCSIWAKPTSCQPTSVTEASEVVQTLYMRAYEKKVQSKGEYRLRIIIGKDAAAACSKSDFIIRDTAMRPGPNDALFQSIDGLILGCRPKGESLEEVQFKRGAVAESCRLWLVSSKSEGGRALAKDIAQTAGEIVRKASSGPKQVRDGGMQVQARM
ncbi:L-ornithine 5-monooxygenase [Pyrenophora teres f. maculata]|nr:L-ornithine 5-monooxygenase [Pyrenophora teres f. maculata]